MMRSDFGFVACLDHSPKLEMFSRNCQSALVPGSISCIRDCTALLMLLFVSEASVTSVTSAKVYCTFPRWLIKIYYLINVY